LIHVQCRVVVFFFFQAEDGIRDFHVTGVQTCALPISERTPALTELDLFVDAVGHAGNAGAAEDGAAAERAGTELHASLEPRHRRSEERRVGKEGRSRWSRYV